MKEIILLMCGLLIGLHLFAQKFSEWFQQNQTELKYLAAQIAALRGYDGLLRAGYPIVDKGLDSIGSVTDDDRHLHATHFASWDVPAIEVQEDAAIGSIQQYCALLPMVAEEIETLCRGLPAVPLDWPAIGPVVARGLRQTAKICERWLRDILTEARYKMDDASRLRVIDDIHSDLRNTYGKAMLLMAELNHHP